MVEKPLEESPQFTPVVVPDGIYDVKVQGHRTNVHPKYGESLIIDFEIQGGSHNGKVVGGFASYKKVTKKTKLYRWALNLGASVPQHVGETFDPDNMIGKTGKVLTMQIKRIDREGREFWNSVVKDVLAPAGVGSPASSPQPLTGTPTQPLTGTQPITTGTPLSPQPQTTVSQGASKIDLLKRFEGREFLKQELTNFGFADAEINSLVSMGYVVDLGSGKMKLAG